MYAGFKCKVVDTCKAWPLDLGGSLHIRFTPFWPTHIFILHVHPRLYDTLAASVGDSNVGLWEAGSCICIRGDMVWEGNVITGLKNEGGLNSAKSD